MTDFAVGGLPPNYWESTAFDWSPDTSTGDLRDLLSRLRALGVEPTEAAAFDAIATAVAGAAAPAYPPRVLDCTPTVVLDTARRIGVWQASAGSIQQHLHQMQQQAARELQQSMAAEADSYILQLRPAFDAAAQQARDCANLGITPDDDPEQIMQRGAAASTAWLAFKNSTSLDTLERIAAARMQMSRGLGIFPVRTTHGVSRHRRIDYGPCFTLPHQTFEPSGRGAVPPTPWRRWLRLAPHLHLNTSDEITAASSGV